MKPLLLSIILSVSALAEIKVVTTDMPGATLVSVKSTDVEVGVYKIIIQSKGLSYTKLVLRSASDTPESIPYTNVLIDGPTTVDLVTVTCFRLAETQYRLTGKSTDITYPLDGSKR